MKKQTTELVNFEFNDATAMRPRSVWCCWDGSGPKERAESTQRTAESTGQHTAKNRAEKTGEHQGAFFIIAV